MVDIAVRCTGLVGMTGSTGVARTRGDYTGYGCGRGVVMLAVRTVIRVTRITVTGLEVMQRDNLTPGADRSMAAATTGATSYLIYSTTVISYVMTGGSCMGRMAVKVRGMTGDTLTAARMGARRTLQVTG